MRRRAALKPIKTYCEDLDAMMGGGVPVGQITEFCGVPGAGQANSQAAARKGRPLLH
jgi:RecA/RadA recombinase